MTCFKRKINSDAQGIAIDDQRLKLQQFDMIDFDFRCAAVFKFTE